MSAIAFQVAQASGSQPAALAGQILEQLDRQSLPHQPCLGLIYLTRQAEPMFAQMVEPLREQLPSVQWVGAVADAIIANDDEFADAPAACAMLMALPAGSWQVFNGQGPLTTNMHTALVHADPRAPELGQLISELAARTRTGYLFGGLTAASPARPTQISLARQLSGGLSGVGFDERVQLLSRVTQGCTPLAPEHEITECRSQFVIELDGRPALDVLLEDLDVDQAAGRTRDGDEILRALPADRLRQGLLVGLAESRQDRPMGFGDYQVTNLVGIDPENRLLAVAGHPADGNRLVFCTRDREAARRDLIRACTELRDQIESDRLSVLGAHFVSCVARGEALFGTRGAESRLVRHNLGDVPVVGFYANGEIARERLYGFTGVITLFVVPA